MTQIRFKKQEKKKKPPFLCRYFRHDRHETEYSIEIVPKHFTVAGAPRETPLYVCKRCGDGMYFDLFGPKIVSPKAVIEFVNKQSIKAVKEPPIEKGQIHFLSARGSIEK